MDRAQPSLLLDGSIARIGDHTLDAHRNVLLDAAGQVVELRPQAFQVLRHLALNAGRLVSKEELLAAVWPGLVVTDDSLVQAVGDIRRALGARGHEVLKTVPRRGYMLTVELQAAVASPGPPAPTVPPAPPAPPAPVVPVVPVVPPIPPHAAPLIDTDAPAPVVRAPRRRLPLGLALALLTLVALGLLATALWHGPPAAQFDAAKQPPLPSDRASIAVLAFRDPQGDADAQLLARGLAEDLAGELAHARDLRVVSHQSSFQFDARKTPPGEIGQRLRTRYLVDGTVRREGEQLRVGVQLLNTHDGQIVWSANRLIERAGLAAAQQDFVGRIAGALQQKVRATEQRSALTQSPTNLDTFVLTQRGKSSMETYSPQGLRDARRLLEQAVSIDPNYALAWVFLGMTNTIDTGSRVTGEWPIGRMGEVLAQVERAVALQPDLPIAYVALSQAQALARQFDAALASAQRCVQISPNDADCFYILGKAQMHIGQSEAATRNLEQALDRNPLPPAYLPAFYATALWSSRRFEEALRAADDCLVRAPDFWLCRQDRLATLVELGRVAEARQEAHLLTARFPAMTAEWFGQAFADNAVALRHRRIAAAKAAGFPPP